MKFPNCMNVVVTEKLKESWLQIRINDHLKSEVKVVAELRGLSVSALVHSLLVRAIREEKEHAPSMFQMGEISKRRTTVPGRTLKTTNPQTQATKVAKQNKG